MFQSAETAAPPKRSLLSRFWWILVVVAVLGVGSCATVVGAVLYIGATAPETKVYASNEIPDKYRDTINDLRLVDPGEPLIWFYSDSIGDIRDGFSFVSDRKVVVYDADNKASPASVVPFQEIADVRLHRESTWLLDSSITLILKDGRTVGFPVSNELDRDQDVYDTIVKSMPAKPEEE